MKKLKLLMPLMQALFVGIILMGLSACSDDEDTVLGPVYATATSSADGTSITVSWNLVQEIIGYDVELYTGTISSHGDTPVATGSHTTYDRTHTFTDLTPGTDYVVFVTGKIDGTRFTSASAWGVNVTTSNP
jgi:hypothetical protein